MVHVGKTMKFEATIVCKACDGTGLYVGEAERDGAAVICSDCRGTGKVDYVLEYEEFTERRERKDVVRVFKHSFGYVHGVENFNIGSKVIRFGDGGVAYADWLKGVKPLPVRWITNGTGARVLAGALML